MMTDTVFRFVVWLGLIVIVYKLSQVVDLLEVLAK